MRKIFWLVGFLFFLVWCQLGWKYWHTVQLDKDAQRTQGVVLECPEESLVPHETVYATYGYEVDGRKYRGTLETTPLRRGHSLEVFYSRANPAVSSGDNPAFSVGRERSGLWSMTWVLVFWAGLLGLSRWRGRGGRLAR